MNSFGEFFCNLLGRVFWIIPNVPDSMTFSYLAQRLGATIPFVGTQILYELLQDIVSVLILVMAYKTVKILPGKF